WAASSALAAPVASRPRTRTRAHRATNALRLAISFPPRKSGRRLRPVPDSRRNRPRLRQHHRSACPQLRLPAAPPTVYTRRKGVIQDRKSTRLNSSHVKISYAVFCLKKKTPTGSTKVERRAICTVQ